MKYFICGVVTSVLTLATFGLGFVVGGVAVSAIKEDNALHKQRQAKRYAGYYRDPGKNPFIKE